MKQEEKNPIVIKIGGTLVGEAEAQAALWQGVRELREAAPVVVVHGGGAQATALARRLDHEPRIVQGRRVTTDLDLAIAQWALRGGLNTQLVAAAQRQDLAAVGLSGADGGLLRVTKRPPWTVDGEAVDFGWVGDVEAVQTSVLTGLLTGGFVPVVAPLGIDAAGQVYNVNADTVARALAAALQASQLLLVTGAGGVRQGEATLGCCDAETFAAGTAAGWIAGGMRVKLRAAFDALQAGVPDVCVCALDDLVNRKQATRVVV